MELKPKKCQIEIHWSLIIAVHYKTTSIITTPIKWPIFTKPPIYTASGSVTLQLRHGCLRQSTAILAGVCVSVCPPAQCPARLTHGSFPCSTIFTRFLLEQVVSLKAIYQLYWYLKWGMAEKVRSNIRLSYSSTAKQLLPSEWPANVYLCL